MLQFLTISEQKLQNLKPITFTNFQLIGLSLFVNGSKMRFSKIQQQQKIVSTHTPDFEKTNSRNSAEFNF